MNFHISRNGSVFGEFSLDELIKAINTGTVLDSDFAWIEGWDNWRAVGSLEEIQTHKRLIASKNLNFDESAIPLPKTGSLDYLENQKTEFTDNDEMSSLHI